MEKQNATEKLEKQDIALEPGTQNLNEDKALGKADAKLLQDSIKALQVLDEDKVDPDLTDLGYSQLHREAAEDADDEFDTGDDDDDDDDYEEVQPLLVKKAKTSIDGDQVHLPTNHPEQNTQITAHTHSFVKWGNNLAQAETYPVEVGPKAHLASKQNLSRAPTHPKPFPGNRVSGLLYPSPPLHRRKGSNAPRENTSDSSTDHSIMSNTRKDQDAPYGHSQNQAGENSATYLTPTQRGEMPKGRGNQNEFSGEENANRGKISRINPSCTSSEEEALKPNEWGPTKASKVLGYVVEEETNPKKSMTDRIRSPKAIHEKMTFRKFFHRKASKEPSTPPSSSGKTAGRMTISAPTLIDASPNAQALLNSASPLITESPSTKHVVNYSRPIVHSSSDVSSGSPIARGGSNTALHGSKLSAGPATVREGRTDKSGNITVGLNTSSVSQDSDLQLPNPDKVQIHDDSNSSIIHGHEAVNECHAVTGTLPTESADASDSDSFNPSDYSGDENSVQQAVGVPIVFAGKAKLIDIPPHRVGTAAPINQSSMGNPAASGTTQLTDHDAEILGAQDADRYYNNAMATRTRPTSVTTDDPFIDPPFRNLLAKPANEIAAKEMERIRAGREEERQINAIIKAQLAAKDAANGGIRGAGFQRIDYGPPTARTTLGGNPPSEGH